MLFTLSLSSVYIQVSAILVLFALFCFQSHLSLLSKFLYKSVNILNIFISFLQLYKHINIYVNNTSYGIDRICTVYDYLSIYSQF